MLVRFQVKYLELGTVIFENTNAIKIHREKLFCRSNGDVAHQKPCRYGCGGPTGAHIEAEHVRRNARIKAGDVVRHGQENSLGSRTPSEAAVAVKRYRAQWRSPRGDLLA